MSWLFTLSESEKLNYDEKLIYDEKLKTYDGKEHLLSFQKLDSCIP